MENSSLSQEIIEHVLQYADGETLLVCREVSPQFAAAVDYLSKTKNIWKECYMKEKHEKYPYALVSKLHPHDEGFRLTENWSLIYELCAFVNLISCQSNKLIREVKIGKELSVIKDVLTHGDITLLLVKYSKDYSTFYRILTVDSNDIIIGKSHRFNADALYITAAKNPSTIRRDAIVLNCDNCTLIAVPIDTDPGIEGYPKFKRQINFLTVEHSNGDVLWLKHSQGLLDKGCCFYVGNVSKHSDIQKQHSRCVKAFQRFTSLFISCGDTHQEFNTFKKLRANVTASICYSNLLILGTETGMLYVYNINNEVDLKLLDLENHICYFDVCSAAILVIDVMELKDHFVIVCCSAKSLYQIQIERNIKNFL